MKKITYAFFCSLVLLSFSCKDAKKNQEVKDAQEVSESTEMFSIIEDSSKVGFTAYKTTEKVPVSGEFKEINITKSQDGSTPLEALNGLEFSIPVSSLFTNDPTGVRDPKLLEFFFNVMKNPELISGSFKVEDNKCSVDLTLNGETHNLPLEHATADDSKITLTGVMNLEDWNAMDAVNSINKACEILHTGKDGVSKTWSEVALNAEVMLQKK